MRSGKIVLFVGGLFVTGLMRLNGESLPVAEEATLTDQLREKAEASKAKSPPERQAIMEKALEELRASKIVAHAKKKGDRLPVFELPDAKGGMVSSVELLKKGPLVVVFYRGGWCPYCNLQLNDLQKHLPEIEKRGGQLVAISPQTPDNSVSTVEKGKLDFIVLSDVGSQVAHQFGLVFRLPPDLKAVYKEFGLDLGVTNGTTEWELPLAASYVVSSDGKIVYSFLDVDYKKRAETRDILQVLDALSKIKKHR